MGNYSVAYKAIDSCKTMNLALKDQEKNEIILYESKILQKQAKFAEVVTLMEEQEQYLKFNLDLYSISLFTMKTFSRLTIKRITLKKRKRSAWL